MKKIEQEDKEDEANGMPPRFGIRQKVDYNLNNSGEWDTLENGDKIWRLSISCQGALSINLLYDKFWIPDGAKFFIYSDDHQYSIGAITSQNNIGDKNDPHGFATGLVYGNEITLEYYIPNEVTDTGVISIAYVVNGYKYIIVTDGQMVGPKYGESGSCQVNVNCIEGQNWQKEKNAVALIIMDGSYICTGSLINTTANNNSPLFLTANHCLVNGKDAITSPDLSQWSFYWQYESPGCAKASPSTTYLTVGATVVANNPVSDFALLKLAGNPLGTTGVTPYYLGWDRSGSAGTGGVGIHHPSGDVKKIATYSGTPTNSSCVGDVNNNFWQTGFIKTSNGYSVMEPGSSGSPLINSNHRVIGQLYGPGSCSQDRCNNPSNQRVSYGKFSVSWTGSATSTPATDNRRRLNYWLDPAGTNSTTLDGIGGCVISGTSILCPYSSYTYTLTGKISNAPVTWTCSSNLTLVSAQGNNAIFTTNSTTAGGASIQASFSGSTFSRIVYVIQNPATETHGAVTVYTNSLFTIAPQTPDIISYRWTVQPATGAILSNTNGLTLDIRFTQTGTYMVYAYGKKCTESSNPTHIYVYNVVSPSSYTSSVVYPNPVSDVLTIDREQSSKQVESMTTKATTSTTTDKSISNSSLNIRLYDVYGKLLLHKKATAGRVQLNVSHLHNGNYYLHIYDGVSDKPEIQQIIVKH